MRPLEKITVSVAAALLLAMRCLSGTASASVPEPAARAVRGGFEMSGYLSDGMKMKLEARTDAVVPAGGKTQWVPGAAMGLVCAFSYTDNLIFIEVVIVSTARGKS